MGSLYACSAPESPVRDSIEGPFEVNAELDHLPTSKAAIRCNILYVDTAAVAPPTPKLSPTAEAMTLAILA